MKWIIFLILILASGLVNAEESPTYRPNEAFGLPVHVINSSGDVTGASCFIQIKYSNFTTAIDAAMMEVGMGWYNYTYQNSITGRYYCRQNCTQGTLFSADTCNFEIQDEENSGPYYFYIVILVFFIFLMWFGFKAEKAMPLTIAGFLLAVLAVSILTNGFPGLENSFLQESMGLILLGISMFLMVAPNVDELGKMF